jgi:two-component system CheB/CheR fusion protein
LLVAELQHRTRNLMAVIRSMTRRTVERSARLSDFETTFLDRLDALARVQRLLSRLGENDQVTFDELIASEIEAMSGEDGRVTLTGPRGIRLRSSSVEPLAMALHELATNAIKYGALGQPQARLAISWAMATPDRVGRARLRIEWRERGVVMRHPNPSNGSGRGRELIEESLPYQADAETHLSLEPDGAHCIITLPIPATN